LSAPPSLPILTTRRALPPPGFLWSASLSPLQAKTLGSLPHFPSLFLFPRRTRRRRKKKGSEREGGRG